MHKKPTQHRSTAKAQGQLNKTLLAVIALIVVVAGIGTGFLVNNFMNPNTTNNNDVPASASDNQNDIAVESTLPPETATQQTFSSTAEAIQATNEYITTQLENGLTMEQIQATRFASLVNPSSEAATQNGISISNENRISISVADANGSALDSNAFVDCVPERYSFPAHSDSGIGDSGFIIIGASTTDLIFYGEQFYAYLEFAEVAQPPMAVMIYLDVETVLPSDGATTSRVNFFAPNASPFTQVEISMLGVDNTTYGGAGTVDISWMNNGDFYVLDGTFDDLTMREFRVSDNGFFSLPSEDTQDATASFSVQIPSTWLDGCPS